MPMVTIQSLHWLKLISRIAQRVKAIDFTMFYVAKLFSRAFLPCRLGNVIQTAAKDSD